MKEYQFVYTGHKFIDWKRDVDNFAAEGYVIVNTAPQGDHSLLVLERTVGIKKVNYI